MSEYQSYEFVALDRPLSPQDMAALRAISTRAEITPTRFWNEYHWGNLKADPAKLLARYFDAHLYFTNWGSRRLMFRLPAERVDREALRPYFPGGPATLTEHDGHVVIELWSEIEEPGEDWFAGSQLAALTPLRTSLLQGDLTVAYLAWLLAVQSEDVRDDQREPPVPPGLGTPSGPVSALAAFLHIDADLLQAAAEASPTERIDPAALARWVKALPAKDKEGWLLRAIETPEEPLGGALLAAYRRQKAPPSRARARTVAALRTRTEEIRQAREAAEAQRAAQQRARAAAARRKHLDALAKREGQAWTRLDELVAARSYEAAVQLTVDLRDVALSAGALPAFESRLAELEKRYARRRGYRDAIRRALARPPEAAEDGGGES